MKTLIQTVSLGIALIALTTVSVMAQGGSPVVSNTTPSATAPKVEKRIQKQRARISHKLKKGKINQDQANQ